jgi:hypothetical protein
MTSSAAVRYSQKQAHSAVKGLGNRIEVYFFKIVDTQKVSLYKIHLRNERHKNRAIFPLESWCFL